VWSSDNTLGKRLDKNRCTIDCMPRTLIFFFWGGRVTTYKGCCQQKERLANLEQSPLLLLLTRTNRFAAYKGICIYIIYYAWAYGMSHLYTIGLRRTSVDVLYVICKRTINPTNFLFYHYF